MNEKTIFIRTDSGEDEVRNRTARLSKDIKRALLMVDGTATVAELTKRSSPSLRSVLGDMFTELEQGGYIRDKAKPAPAVKRVVIPAASKNTDVEDELDFTAAYRAPTPEMLAQEAAKLKGEKAQDAAASQQAEARARKETEDRERKEAEDRARVVAEERARLGADFARLKAEQLVEVERRKAEFAQIKAQQQAEVNRRQADAEAQVQAAQAEQARLQAEAARIKAEKETARARAEAESQARQEAERRARESVEAARLKAEQHAAQVRAEAEAKAREAAEEKARLKAELVRLKAQAEAEASARAEAMEQARRDAEAARLKADQEAARLRQQAEEARLQAEQEAARTKQEADQEAARLRQQAEEARLQAEQEAARIRQEAEAARLQAEQEAVRIRQEAEAARLQAEQEAARIRQEAEQLARTEMERREREEVWAAQLRAEQLAAQARAEAEAIAAAAEQARRDAEEARARAEQEAARMRQEAEEARSQAEQEVARLRQQAEEDAREAAARRAREEDEAAHQQEARQQAQQRAEAESRAAAEEKARLEAVVAELKAQAETAEREKQQAEAARLRSEQDAARAQIEAVEQARREAEQAASQARAEAERERQRSVEELLTAEQARVRAEQHTAQIVAELESARVQAEQDAEAARHKVEEASAQIREAAEQARQASEARKPENSGRRSKKAKKFDERRAAAEAWLAEAGAGGAAHPEQTGRMNPSGQAQGSLAIELAPFDLKAVEAALEKPTAAILSYPERQDDEQMQSAIADQLLKDVAMLGRATPVEPPVEMIAPPSADLPELPSASAAQVRIEEWPVEPPAERSAAPLKQLSEQEARKLADAQARAWAEAEQRALEQAKKVAAQTAAKAAQAQAAAAPAETPLNRMARMRRVPWAAVGGGVFALLLAALFVLPYVVPTEGYRESAEQWLGRKLQQPVQIGKLGVRILPTPRLMLSEVAVGQSKPIQVAQAQVDFSFQALLGGQHEIKRLTLDGVTVNGAALPEVAGWLQKTAADAQYPVARITLGNGKLEGEGVTFSEVAGDVLFDASGKFVSADLHSHDSKIGVDIKAAVGNKYPVALELRDVALPLLPKWTFNDLKAGGVLDGEELRLTSLDGRILGGVLTGEMRLGWHSGWHAQGALLAKVIPAQNISPLMSGDLDGTAHFQMHAFKLSELADSAVLDGVFTVSKGLITGMDIVETVRLRSPQSIPGGRTHFDEMAGELNYANGIYRFSRVSLKDSVMKANGALTVTGQKLSGSLAADLAMRSSGTVALTLGGTTDMPTLQTAH